MKQLYLVRHGETAHNRTGVYYGRIDCPLNAHGQEQAAALADHLRAVPAELIVTSPLLRAADTARAIAEGRDLPLHCDDRLMELSFGAWEGKSWRELQDDAHWQRWSADWQHTAPPGGESFDQLLSRAQAFYDELLTRPQECAIIVCHHMVLLALTTILLETAPENCWHYRVDTGHYCRFDFDGTYAVLTAFNRGGAEPHTPSLPRV